jgi:hypothetical protein
MRTTYHRVVNHFRHTQWYSLVTWVKWKLNSVRLEIVLLSALDRCKVCIECTPAWKSLWTQPMVLLGDVGQVEAYFGPFRDSINLSARWVHGLRQMYHGHGKSFLAHPMVLLGDVCHVKVRVGPFGDSVSLGTRLVYGLHRMYNGHENLSRHTRWYFLVTLVKWKLILDCSGIILISTQYRGTVCAKCTIGSEIALGAPDGTPRCRRSSETSFLLVWR